MPHSPAATPLEHDLVVISPNLANWTQRDIQALDRAAHALRQGQLVAFPTETVYGLGALATDEDAVARIFAAKNRPVSNPLIVHAPNLAMLTDCGMIELNDRVEARLRCLAEAFWPGPLTLIVPRGPAASDLLTGGTDTLGIRIPDHAVALELLMRTGQPVAAPSANRSMRLSPTSAGHVANSLDPADLAMILDGGPCAIGIESTVLDITPYSEPRILRPGIITPTDLATRLQCPVLAPTELPSQLTPMPDGALRSPGMMADHYQPRIPLVLIGPEWYDNKPETTGDWMLIEPGVPLNTPDPDRMLDDRVRCVQLSLHPPFAPVRALMQLPMTAEDFAREFYSALHIAQESGVSGILMAPVPEDEAWHAVRDRLRRAATKHRPTIESVRGILPWHF